LCKTLRVWQNNARFGCHVWPFWISLKGIVWRISLRGTCPKIRCYVFFNVCHFLADDETWACNCNQWWLLSIACLFIGVCGIMAISVIAAQRDSEHMYTVSCYLSGYFPRSTSCTYIVHISPATSRYNILIPKPSSKVITNHKKQGLHNRWISKVFFYNEINYYFLNNWDH